jgi:hypothetical protein
MAKYIITAYAARVGKKMFRAHGVYDEKDFPDDSLGELLKRNFIRVYDEKYYNEHHVKKESKESLDKK